LFTRLSILLKVLLSPKLIDRMTDSFFVEYQFRRVTVRREHGFLGRSHFELALGKSVRGGEASFFEIVVESLESDEVVVVVRCCGVVDEGGVVRREDRLGFSVEHPVVLGLDLRALN
jgi:hypothetical protein